MQGKRVGVLIALVAGCSSESAQGEGESSAAETPTYFRDAKVIVDARCATCHVDGDIAPFPLTTLEEIRAFEGAVRLSIENNTMPPWKASDACGSYIGDTSLSAEEKSTLLQWLDEGLPEGDPADEPAPYEPDVAPFEPNLVLQLPEPYVPTKEPDDYRCQLIPWPEQETRFVTGLQVTPDQRALVHHVIVYAVGPDDAARYQAFDDAEEGPGYTCYGGPTASTEDGGAPGGSIDTAALLEVLQSLGITLEDVREGNLTDEQLAAIAEELQLNSLGAFASLGSWVPGAATLPFPEGTGIKIEPGSVLIAQIHYNTISAEPVADQSFVELSLTDVVEREAIRMRLVDVGWLTDGLIGDPLLIPAGESDVAYSTTASYTSIFPTMARNALGLSDDIPLVLHRADHHMHELGTSQRSELHHGDGSTSCLLDIPEWDFAWQGEYALETPITFRPGDELWMGCRWDNSAANQPILDGEAKEPTDVSWGEGTTDEMCLASFYVTSE